MNVRSFTTTILLASAFCNPNVASSQSRLQDPGFEPNEDRAQDLNAWSIQSNGFSVDLDESISQSGAASLRIRAIDDARSALIQQSVDGTFLREQAVRLTGYIRTEEIGGSATLVVIVEGDGERIFVDDMRGREVVNTTEWAQHAVAVPQLPNAETLTVGALVIGETGKAWFDTFEMEALTPQGEMSKLARDYLTEVLNHLEKRSLFREKIEWADVRRGVESLAAGAQSTKDTYPAIRYVFQQLKLQGDRHSYFRTPRETTSIPDGNSSSDQESRLPVVTGRVIGNRFGYLDIAEIGGSVSEDIQTRYVNSGHRIIGDMARAGVCGWIIDLHRTGGGTLWPILAAVGPVLGEGTVGSFVDGERKTEFWYRNGASGAGESISVIASPDVVTVLDTSFPPVVVLTSSDTSSASETVAISFIGRPNTLRVGRPTAGFTSANVPIPLSDGAMLVIASAYEADRDGNVYIDSIHPDREVAASVDDVEFLEQMLDAATEWLSTQPGCR